MRAFYIHPRKKRQGKGRILAAILALAFFALLGGLLGVGKHQASDVLNSGKATEPEAGVQREAAIAQPVVGLIAPLSGPFEREGRSMRDGVSLAWRGMGAKGAQGELLVQDGADSVEAGRIIREFATNPDMALVIAHLPASVVSKVIPIFEEARVPLVVPANSHQGLIDQQWTFPLIPSDYAEGAAAASMAAGWSGNGAVAVIHDPGSYGILLSSGFKERAAKEGLSVKAMPCKAEDTFLQSIVGEIVKGNPSMIWLAGPPDWGAEVLGAIAATGYSGRILAPQTYARMARDDIFGAYADRLSMLWPLRRVDGEDAELRVFRTHFLQSFLQEPDWPAALGYDAIMCVAKVFESGAITRSQIRDHLRGYSSPEHACQGLAGSFYFDVKGRVQRPFGVVAWKGGKLEEAP